MPHEATAAWFLKSYAIQICMAALAGLARYYLLSPKERTLSDLVSFFIFAVFISQTVAWIVGPLAWNQDTKYAAAALGALLANEIIRGLLRLAMKIFPLLESKLSKYVEKVKL